MAAEGAARRAMEHGLRQVEVLREGPGSGREAAIRALQAAGLHVLSIRDVTPIPHNGCRPPEAPPSLGAEFSMARYTGPVCRLCRRYGEKLYLKGDRCFSPSAPSSAPQRRPASASQRRRKVSDRGLQLREKQRARVFYGLLEKQFRGYYNEALRRTGVTGEAADARAGVPAGQRGVSPGLRGLAQAGTPAGAPRPHSHSTAARRTFPLRRSKSATAWASRPRGMRTEYAKMLQETLKSKQAARLARAGHGSDEGPDDLRADAGARRRRSSTRT